MEESTQPTTKSVSIKWGAIGGLIGIIYFLILDFTGQSQNQPLQYVGMIFTVLFIFLAHKEYKDDGDGFMSYSKGLGIGTLYSLISSGISSVFVFIYVSFINPQMIETARENAMRGMEESGQSQSQIDQAMPFVEMMTSPVAFLVMGIFFGVFFGFIISLLVSIFTKNAQPESI